MPHFAHVVVVDDNDFYRELLSLAVQEYVRADCVTAYASPKEAYAAICSGEFPQVLLLDLHMPHGEQLVSKLRERGCTSNIVIVSAEVSDEERKNCLDAGADAVVVKPDSFEELGRHLQEVLCSSTGTQPSSKPPI